MNDMDELEKALDNCLEQVMSGQASVAECLRQYPGQAAELKPMLVAALGVGRGRNLTAPRSYKTRARSRLMDYVEAHPKRRSVFSPLAMRLTAGIAMLLAVVTIAGTAYAQNALPGQAFYDWKITSEKAWRAVAPNPIAVDLSIADRRAEELTVLAKQRGQSDQAYYEAQTLQEYHASLQQLQNDANPQDMGQIMQTLEAHKKQFQQAGIDVPQLDAILHGNGNDNPGGGNSGGGGSGGSGGGGKP